MTDTFTANRPYYTEKYFNEQGITWNPVNWVENDKIKIFKEFCLQSVFPEKIHEDTDV